MDPIKPTPPASGRPVTTTVPPLAAALATYQARSGGDGASFIQQYQAKMTEGGAAAAAANAKLLEYAGAARNQIRERGTYFQNRDLVDVIDSHIKQAPLTHSGNTMPGATPAGAADLNLDSVAPMVGAYEDPGKPNPNASFGERIKNYANEFLANRQLMQIASTAQGDKLDPVSNTIGAFINGLTSPVRSIDEVVRTPVTVTAMVKNVYGALLDKLEHPTLSDAEKKSHADLREAATRSQIDNSGWAGTIKHVADWMDKFTASTTGAQNNTQAFSRDANGNIKFSGEGVAEMTGTAFGQLAGILGTAGAMTGPAATRMTYMLGTLHGLDPTVRAAKAAGWDDNNANGLGLLVAPLMAVMDAKLGVERLISSSGSLKELKGNVLTQALKGLSGDLTAADFQRVLKNTVSGYGKGLIAVARRAGAVGREATFEMADEGISQVLAERGVQQMFGYLTGRSGANNPNGKFGDNLGMDMANNMAGSFFAGGAGGLFHSPLAQGSVFHQIDQAVQSGKDVNDIMSGFTPTIRQLEAQGMSEEDTYKLFGNVQAMVETAHGLKSRPDLTPESRYTYYHAGEQLGQVKGWVDAVNQWRQELPAQQQQLAELEAQPETAEIIAQKADLTHEIQLNQRLIQQEDQQGPQHNDRKINFLTNLRRDVLASGKEFGVAEGIANIDAFKEGQSIIMPDHSNATIASISDDGQTLTTDTGQAVAAQDIRTYQPPAPAAPTPNPGQASAQQTHTSPVPAMGLVGLDAKPLADYKAGDQLIVNGYDGNPARHTIQQVNHNDGTITLRDEAGNDADYDIHDLLDNDEILGGYDPDLALRQVSEQKYNEDRDKRKTKLQGQLSPDQLAALNSYPDDQVLTKLQQLQADKNNKDSKLLAEYLQIRAEEKGLVPIGQPIPKASKSGATSPTSAPVTTATVPVTAAPAPVAPSPVEVIPDDVWRRVLDNTATFDERGWLAEDYVNAQDAGTLSPRQATLSVALREEIEQARKDIARDQANQIARALAAHIATTGPIQSGKVQFDPQTDELLINNASYFIPDGQTILDIFELDRDGNVVAVTLNNRKGFPKRITQPNLLENIQEIAFMASVAVDPSIDIDGIIAQETANQREQEAEADNSGGLSRTGEKVRQFLNNTMTALMPGGDVNIIVAAQLAGEDVGVDLLTDARTLTEQAVSILEGQAQSLQSPAGRNLTDDDARQLQDFVSSQLNSSYDTLAQIDKFIELEKAKPAADPVQVKDEPNGGVAPGPAANPSPNTPANNQPGQPGDSSGSTPVSPAGTPAPPAATAAPDGSAPNPAAPATPTPGDGGGSTNQAALGDPAQGVATPDPAANPLMAVANQILDEGKPLSADELAMRGSTTYGAARLALEDMAKSGTLEVNKDGVYSRPAPKQLAAPSKEQALMQGGLDRLLAVDGIELSPGQLASAARVTNQQATEFLSEQAKAGRLTELPNGLYSLAPGQAQPGLPAHVLNGMQPQQQPTPGAVAANPATLAAVGVPDGVKLMVAARSDQLTLGTMLTFRDGMALIRYTTTDFGGKNTREVTKWVTVQEADGKTVVFDKAGKALDVSGEGPLLGEVPTYQAGDPVYVSVPSLGDDVRQVTVVSQDGNKLQVATRPGGNPLTAYADQSTTTPPTGWVDPTIRTQQNSRKSWGNETTSASDPAGVSEMVARMQAKFPNVRVALRNNEQMAADFGDRNGQGPLGAALDGVVYINTDRATRTTPLHEFGHLWGDVMKSRFPNRWQQGLERVKGSVYEARVRDEYPNLTGDDILEEALIQAIEDNAESQLQAEAEGPAKPLSIGARIKQYINDAMRKLSEATGWNWLSPDATLGDFVANEAKNLLNQNVLTDQSSEELAGLGPDGARLAVYPAGTPLPTIVDENFIRTTTLNAAQRKELYGDGLYANDYDANGQWVRRRFDAVADRQTFDDTHAQLESTATEKGIVGQSLSKVLNKGVTKSLLDIRVLQALTIGVKDSPLKGVLDRALKQSRREGAAQEKLNFAIEEKLHRELRGISSYRNITLHSDITPEVIPGLDAKGNPTTLSLTPSQTLGLVGQYRTIMADYGHVPEVNGRPGLTVWRRDPGDRNKSTAVFVEKAQLRRLENTYLAQPEYKQIMDDLQDHFTKTFGAVNSRHTMTEGKALKPSKWYFPLRVAKTKDGKLISEQDLLLRKISSIIEDASQLRDRQGVPSEVWAEDILKVVERYNNGAKNYVAHQPVVQNVAHLYNNFGPDMVNQGRASLKDALENYTTGLASPNAALVQQMNNPLFRAAANSVKLATLARFAFNVGIPLKQFTGVSSAIGNGMLDDKYILKQGLATGRRIALAYSLVGRGYKDGNYAALGGGDTELDTGKNEMEANPYLTAGYQRVSGAPNPDVAFADFGGSPEGTTPGRLRYNWGKFLAWQQEHGLSITQRADTGVIISLYYAAKAQVADEALTKTMTPDEQLRRIADLTEHAMYYSNQTFDKTDKSSFQMDGGTINSLLGLYQGQGFKLFSTMALRNVEAALEPKGSPARYKAEKEWGKSVAMNVVFGSIFAAGVQSLVTALRKLPAALISGSDDDLLKFKDFYGQAMGTAFQNIPVLGDAGVWLFRTITDQPVYDQPFQLQLFESMINAATGTAGAINDATFKPFRSDRERQTQIAKDVDKAIKGTAETVGFSNEAARQIANLVKLGTEPEKRPRRETTGESVIGSWLSSD